MDDFNTSNNKEVMVTQAQLAKRQKKTQVVDYKNHPQQSTYQVIRKDQLLIHRLPEGKAKNQHWEILIFYGHHKTYTDSKPL
jgi:hypothetical protein